MVGIVEYFGPNKSSYACGYCKSNKPDNSSYGLWAHEMTPEMYQIMVDRAWRRSGKYCYKSVLDRICCPTFTIRCEALNFKPSRSQRRVLKRFNDFIYHGIKPKSYEKDPEQSVSSKSQNGTQSQINQSNTLLNSATSSKDDKMPTQGIQQVKDRTKKAKYIRLQRRIAKITSKCKCSKEEAFKVIQDKVRKKCQQFEKPYEAYFKMPDNVDKPAHNLRIKFVSTSNEEHVKYFKVCHQLYEKYQTIVHNDEPSDCTTKQFKRFLVDNPFEPKQFCKDTKPIPTSYGSYFMQYWLDDKLISVAVLDVLPNCVSSVYLFYDPAYSFLSLGTYSALREIFLVRNLHQINPSISYYYLGLYIHSCPKMNYKGKFHPSYLLCDQALTWHPIEHCISKLKSHTHPRFQDDPNKIDEDSLNIQDDDILIFYAGKIFNLSMYKQYVNSEDSDDIYEYARLVGKKCTKSLLLYRKGTIFTN